MNACSILAVLKLQSFKFNTAYQVRNTMEELFQVFNTFEFSTPAACFSHLVHESTQGFVLWNPHSGHNLSSFLLYLEPSLKVIKLLKVLILSE